MNSTIQFDVGDTDGIAVLTIDCPDRPVNVITARAPHRSRRRRRAHRDRCGRSAARSSRRRRPTSWPAPTSRTSRTAWNRGVTASAGCREQSPGLQPPVPAARDLRQAGRRRRSTASPSAAASSSRSPATSACWRTTRRRRRTARGEGRPAAGRRRHPAPATPDRRRERAAAHARGPARAAAEAQKLGLVHELAPARRGAGPGAPLARRFAGADAAVGPKGYRVPGGAD